jgi:EAL domain-containing protein (putative c-di-GMP-specific phosphodiesterase class I)
VVAAGCELIQGYYHHYPMSLEEFVDLLVTEQNVPQLRRAG